MNNVLILVAILTLSTGCAVIATATGASASTVTAVKTAEAIKFGADLVSYGTTDKTITDHAISKATGKDCKLTNIFNKQAPCQDIDVPKSDKQINHEIDADEHIILMDHEIDVDDEHIKEIYTLKLDLREFKHLNSLTLKFDFALDLTNKSKTAIIAST